MSLLIKDFLNGLRLKKEFHIFLDLERVPQMGVGDFPLLNQSGMTLALIEKRLNREKQYGDLSSFVRDMNAMVEGVQDYLLLSDPYQEQCEQIKRYVREFAHLNVKRLKEQSSSCSESKESRTDRKVYAASEEDKDRL